MKYLLVICCLLWQMSVKAQSFYIYKDTVSNFSISVPETWKYQATPDSPSMKIAGVNVSSMDEKRVPDNFNVAVFKHPGLNTDSAFSLLQKMTKRNRLQAVKDTGTYWVNGEKMRWFEDMHAVPNMNDTICGSYFVVYRKGFVYMITGISRISRLKESRDLFHQIAQSFELLKPGGKTIPQRTLPKAAKSKGVTAAIPLPPYAGGVSVCTLSGEASQQELSLPVSARL
ncbi:hypothetical protein [Chitinophaga sp. S165]|uniref:hypothetical protein n=1 Tax=Chitinophaga sp. S165 TaxID=2135462 RepID=UPI000D84CDB5|nr:hypothetical protein [Chitinophaga sp. S165]PWV56318.1 hypothetical protein C7475_101833 [Chitinophaga sp. S165]